MKRFEDIKKVIDSAENIKILFPETPSIGQISSVLSLYFTLKKINKKVFLPVDRIPKEILSLLQNKEKRITISFNKPISEISYDNDKGNAKLFAVSKDKDFNETDIRITTEPVTASFETDQLSVFDLILCIGIKDFSEVDNLLNAEEEELFNCTIINIDNDLKNENYGDINVVEEDSFIKITSLIIKQIEKVDEDAMNWLMCGMFSQEKLNIEDLNIVKWITRNKAKLDLYYAKEGLDKPAWTSLFEELINNAFISKEKDALFTYIETNTEKNLEFTKEIILLSKLVHGWISPPSFFISFIDPKDNATSMIFFSSDNLLVEKLKNKYDGQFKENSGIIYFLELGPKESIETIKASLEKVIN